MDNFGDSLFSKTGFTGNSDIDIELCHLVKLIHYSVCNLSILLEKITGKQFPIAKTGKIVVDGIKKRLVEGRRLEIRRKELAVVHSHPPMIAAFVGVNDYSMMDAGLFQIIHELRSIAIAVAVFRYDN